MFKYYPPSLSLVESVICERTLKYTSPTDFNDPFECTPHFNRATDNELDEYCSEVLQNLHSFKSLPEQYVNQKAYKLNIRMLESEMLANAKNAIKDIGVCCFSQTCESILMWSHYANNHKGFCVEYDVEIGASDIFGFTDTVQYATDYPMVSFIDYCKIQDFAHFGLWESIYPTISNRFISSAIYTKSLDWEYEKEIRSVKTGMRGGAGLHPIPIKLIRNVILGAKVDDNFKQGLCKIISNHSLPINVEQAKVSDRMFKVTV